MKKKILVVEDDREISELLELALTANGYEVSLAEDGSEGFVKFKQVEPDLIISDVMMPNIDGLSFVKIIRVENQDIPIIMLTALKNERDELEGFDAGVNDYVSKPFSIEVLVRRIEQQLKSQVSTMSNIILDGEFKIDKDRYVVYQQGEVVNFTKKEYMLFTHLVEHKGQVVKREKLIELLWGENYYGDNRNLDTHIKNVRRKLDTKQIKTIKGIGYCYE